jgi:hypothetical protein
LLWLLSTASVFWASFYYGTTLGGPASATLGMRAKGLEMRTWYDAASYFVLGAVHAVVYWISVSALSPFVGVVVINSAVRASSINTRMASHGCFCL